MNFCNNNELKSILFIDKMTIKITIFLRDSVKKKVKVFNDRMATGTSSPYLAVKIEPVDTQRYARATEDGRDSSNQSTVSQTSTEFPNIFPPPLPRMLSELTKVIWWFFVATRVHSYQNVGIIM